jgi:hypothetical protein
MGRKPVDLSSEQPYRGRGPAPVGDIFGAKTSESSAAARIFVT